MKRGNGEGSIYYSEKLGRWVGQVSNGRKIDGSINRKSFYGKTRSEVKDKINEALNNIQKNQFVDSSRITLMDIITQYIEDQYNANQIILVTYIRKKHTAEVIEKMPIGNMPIQKITPGQITSCLSELTDYSNSYITKVTEIITIAFDIAVANNIVSNNPFKIKGLIIKPKSNKPTKKVSALTIDEQKAFVKELESYYEPYRTIFYILLYSGMRVGECLALKKEDLENVIHVNKTLTKDHNDRVILGKTTKTYSGLRDIPILADLKPILTSYMPNEDFLFKMNGRFISPSIVNAHFKRVCAKANIRVKKAKASNNKTYNSSEVNTHMLRHTFATRCIEAGMSAVVLSKILGHKNIQVTLNTYTDVFDRYRKEEMMKVDEYFSQLH